MTTTWRTSVLVVANVTVASKELLDAVRAKAEAGPASFRLVVPAPVDGREAARARLDQALAAMHNAGLEAEGELGDSDPMAAVRDAWDPREYDEVIVSTLPGQTSKWLQFDLPHRVAQLTGAQVTHVLAVARPPETQPSRTVTRKKATLGPLSVLSWGGGKDPQR